MSRRRLSSIIVIYIITATAYFVFVPGVQAWTPNHVQFIETTIPAMDINKKYVYAGWCNANGGSGYFRITGRTFQDKEFWCSGYMDCPYMIEVTPSSINGNGSHLEWTIIHELAGSSCGATYAYQHEAGGPYFPWKESPGAGDPFDTEAFLMGLAGLLIAYMLWDAFLSAYLK